MRNKLNRGIQKEIDLNSVSASTSYTKDYIYKMEGFTSRPIYGYQEEEEEFVRVYFSSPWYLQKATQCLGKEVLQKSVFQPFEAHLPFHLQFFVDNSIFGMDNVFVKNVKFRIPEDLADLDDQTIIYKDLTIGDIRKRKSELLSPLGKMTQCLVECDVNVEDILNREMQKDNEFSSNPGLDYIWKDEKERCDKIGIVLEDVFNSYDPRPSQIHPQEREMIRSARQIARKLRLSRNLPSRLDQLMDSQQSPEEIDIQNQTIWESPQEFGSQGNQEGIDEEEDVLNRTREDQEDLEDQKELELEMTMLVDSQKNRDQGKVQERDQDQDSEESEGEEDQEEDLEKIEEHPKQPEKIDKLEWITAPSAFRQKFRTAEHGIENHRENIRENQKNWDEDEILMDETEAGYEIEVEVQTGSREKEETCSRFLTQQTSMEESPSDNEESDIIGLCTISLELLIDTQSEMPNPMCDPIICASIAIYPDVCRQNGPTKHVIITSLRELENVEFCEVASSEIEIFEKIRELSLKFDVDIMIGYDINRLSWGYFWMRGKYLGLNLAMDRIMFEQGKHQEDERHLGKYSNLNQEKEVRTPNGRILVAVWRVIQSDLKLRSYDIGTACSQVLRRKIPILDNSTLTKRIKNPKNCKDVAIHLLKLARINISLLRELNWFFKNAEMARVYGIQFQEVWTRGSQLRVESMLLRMARKMNMVAPSITPIQRNL
ncbi:unnamed protein product [Caenorhabditis angaria]|uniref:DNA-directed DNA polymerase family B exonuclease domain-containing protein n=1 Tax=Caenorhabditis angaria TaxID=860376 RepID=A0A9P1MZB3_9PELO|nr:unnamed protein product [Caenorhabditis angaria]